MQVAYRQKNFDADELLYEYELQVIQARAEKFFKVNKKRKN
jgi:hypothetical protein